MEKACAKSHRTARKIILSALAAGSIAFMATLPATADSTATRGNSNGSASASGSNKSDASLSISGSSRAESFGKDRASGRSTTRLNMSARQTSGAENSNVVTQTTADAGVSSNGDVLQANASASVDANADAASPTTSASAHLGDAVQASATSTPTVATAMASATDGSFATAITGPNGTVISFVPNGTTQTVKKGRKTISYSVNESGSYSIALVRGNAAQASVGVSPQAMQLASGNIHALLRATLSATAFADNQQAMASASATVNGLATTAAGQAQVRGQSFAFAHVKRSGNTVVVSLATSKDRQGCGGNWWGGGSNDSRQCSVMHRVIKVKRK